MKKLDTVAIVGVGKIGGSIGMAIQERGLAKNVVGVGRSQTTLRAARRVGAITNTTIDLNRGVADAELIVVCTPVRFVEETAKQVAQHCPERTLITDVGGVKQALVEPLDDGLARGCRFLGGHPLIDGEKQGVLNARANMFDGRVTILTPTRNTRAEDFDLLEDFWQSLGSVVVRMTPEDHDRAAAMTGQLAYLSSAAWMAALPEQFYRLIGRSVSDSTIPASGNAEQWRQLLSMNRDNVLTALEQFGSKLAAVHTALRDDKQDDLLRFLAQAKKCRDALGN